MLREIGGERLCRMSNESFYAIRGTHSTDLLEGIQYRAYLAVQRAFGAVIREDYYKSRYRGFEFPDGRKSREGVITIGPHIFVDSREGQYERVKATVRFTTKTTQREIVEAIRAATPKDWKTQPIIPSRRP